VHAAYPPDRLDGTVQTDEQLTELASPFPVETVHVDVITGLEEHLHRNT
jgi:hypothetical protein